MKTEYDPEYKFILGFDKFDPKLIDTVVHVALTLNVSYQIAEGWLYEEHEKNWGKVYDDEYYHRPNPTQRYNMGQLVEAVMNKFKPNPVVTYRNNKMREVNDFLEAKRKKIE